MAKLLKLRRGTTSQHNTFTGAEGEVTIDTTKDTAVVHDGSTAGGRPLAREDMSNVSSSSIAGRLGADSIATTKIAAGALPTDVTVGNGNIVNSSVTTSKINNNAVDLNKMQQIGTQVILGRIDSGTGNVQGLSAANARTVLNVENGATADQTAAEIRTLVESATDSNVFTDADHSKLNGIESGATADQSASEILTAIKTVDGSGSGLDADTLDGAQPSASAGNGTIVQRNSSGYIFSNYINTTDNAVTNNTISGIICKQTGQGDYHRTANATAVRGFINVENGATADQTASEIRTLVESASDSNVFTDADHSKLNGIESGATADQTASEINALLTNETLSIDRLDVNGSHGIDNKGWFRNDDSGDGVYNSATGQHFYSDHDDYWNIAGGGSANALRFRDDHGSTVRGYVYADSGNHIGFLNSGSSWSFKVDNSGNATATGNVTAYSDARLKTDIHTINDALSICGKLRGVSYKWIKDGKPSIGIIAQEVEEVLPEVVLTQQVLDPTGEREVKSVDYGKIVGVLINAINELKEEVEELKNAKITG